MSPIRAFRMIALAEGTSFLILLFIAMPMKYLMGMPLAVRVAGSIHGLLFLLYVARLAKLRSAYEWDNKFSMQAFVASILPFGTFFFDKYLREKEAAAN
jgi:integral membrane protein